MLPSAVWGDRGWVAPRKTLGSSSRMNWFGSRIPQVPARCMEKRPRSLHQQQPLLPTLSSSSSYDPQQEWLAWVIELFIFESSKALLTLFSSHLGNSLLLLLRHHKLNAVSRKWEDQSKKWWSGSIQDLFCDPECFHSAVIRSGLSVV